MATGYSPRGWKKSVGLNFSLACMFSLVFPRFTFSVFKNSSAVALRHTEDVRCYFAGSRAEARFNLFYLIFGPREQSVS